MLLASFGVAVLAVAPADIAIAKGTILQTVSLNDTDMSTEGGEARLYRTGDRRRGGCRIEAVHFGEAGKAVYVFDFGSKLHAAERREYHYDVPIHLDPHAKASLTATMTLESGEGRKLLAKDFAKYKALFAARNLARCGGQ